MSRLQLFPNPFRSVNAENCKDRTHEERYLKGDVSFGAEEQFKNEALMAVRTANFISAFLQVVDPKEVFPGTRVVDKPLTEDQVIGESEIDSLFLLILLQGLIQRPILGLILFVQI